MSNATIEMQMKRILDEYTKDAKRIINNSFDEVAKEGAKKLRQTSPTKTGDYAKGWTVKREPGLNGINNVTIHNKTDYQLTHLLENGHIVVNAKGVVGRAPAHVHIAPVEQWANEELPRKIESEL